MSFFVLPSLDEFKLFGFRLLGISVAEHCLTKWISFSILMEYKLVLSN